MTTYTALPPNTTLMKDVNGIPYVVDNDLATLLKYRRVWTDEESGHLMLSENRSTHRLSVWWFRICKASQDIDLNIEVTFGDSNPRHIFYTNLVRLNKESEHCANAPIHHTNALPV